MTHFAPTRYGFVLLVLLAFAGSVACSESNFAGGSKSGDGFGLGSGGGSGGNDGDETDCDPARDPDCDSASGTGTGPGGVTPGDQNGDGIPDAQQGLGTGDANGDGIPDNLQTGGDEGDLNGDGIPDIEQGLGQGDGTATNSLLEDGTITYTHHDEDHSIIIQRLKTAMPDGVAFTNQVDDDVSTITLSKACYTYKKTCFQIKATGNVEQMLGRDSCIAVESQDANSMTINVDTDGKALIGNCLSGSGSDERFTISCPHGIEPQGCAG